MNPSHEHNECSWVEENIDIFLDNDLSSVEIGKLERHLQDCLVCRSEVELARESLNALRDLPEKHCPDRVVEEVMALTENRRDPEIVQVGGKVNFWYKFGLHAAGIAAICLVIFMFAVNTGHEPETTQLNTVAIDDNEMIQAREQVEWALGYVGYISSSNTAAICEEIIEVKLAPTLQNAAEDVLDTHILPKDFKFI